MLFLFYLKANIQFFTSHRYAWTIANCATCETHMGWLFTATNRKLKPKSFWGIRNCQVADETH